MIKKKLVRVELGDNCPIHKISEFIVACDKTHDFSQLIAWAVSEDNMAGVVVSCKECSDTLEDYTINGRFKHVSCAVCYMERATNANAVRFLLKELKAAHAAIDAESKAVQEPRSEEKEDSPLKPCKIHGASWLIGKCKHLSTLEAVGECVVVAGVIPNWAATTMLLCENCEKRVTESAKKDITTTPSVPIELSGAVCGMCSSSKAPESIQLKLAECALQSLHMGEALQKKG